MKMLKYHGIITYVDAWIWEGMVHLMRIERVDDKTVKCYISNEELEEYDIDYKDFIMRSDKAKEMVQEIMEQAEEEFGYKPPKFAFDLQIMLLPDRGLLLTFSDRDPEMKDGDPMMECLKEMKRMLMESKAKADKEKTPAKEDVPLPEEEAKEQKAKEKKKAVPPSFAVFVFSTLGKVMEFASVLPANLRVESSLYEMNGYYYLFFQKGHASYERYSRACVQALEFAALYTADERQTIRIKEHGSCLVAEKAMKKLRG